MKFLKKLQIHVLGWLLVLCMVMAGLVGCGQSETIAVDEKLVGQVVSVAADVIMEEMLAEGESQPQNIEADQSLEEETEVGTAVQSDVTVESETEAAIEQDGWYSDKENVALYIHTYGQLPGNFLTKSEAEDLGWDSGEGNLDKVAPGMSIGGNEFGNREGLLPKKKGRTYYECDINYAGGYRGGERIVFSNDGLIYYTGDHYESFELLYTEEGAAQ